MKVPKEAKQLGRVMSHNPKKYRKYKNSTNPKPDDSRNPIQIDYYIEEAVDMGTAKGKGQRRVVAGVSKQGKVVSKHYTSDHYKTFIPFQ